MISVLVIKSVYYYQRAHRERENKGEGEQEKGRTKERI